MKRRLPVYVAFAWLACLSDAALTAEIETGLDLYSQGGVVVDGIAYFTANDSSRREGVTRTADYPCVVAFDAETHRKLRAYDFEFTYDSSPLVVQDSKGTWLVIAHEHKRARTVAIERDSGQVRWTSAANQPGNYFFGYSFYDRRDGRKLILMACRNGLHTLSVDTGEDAWWVQRQGTGGVTPCVDQTAGMVFFQCNGKVLKIRGDDGLVLKEVDVPWPNTCISWNTVLIDDAHGDFIATRWYGQPEWDSAIRVYDHDLNLVWQDTRSNEFGILASCTNAYRIDDSPGVMTRTVASVVPLLGS
jgi:outer membrane protein assembly factor BamB